MSSGVRLAAALAVLVVGLVLAIGGTDAGGSTSKIDALVLRDTAGGKKASFLIHLSDQADSGRRIGFETRTRGWYVYRALREHASRAQPPIRALLEARNASYKPYWAANVIATRGDRQLVQELAQRGDVSAIESNDESNWLEGERASGASPTTVDAKQRIRTARCSVGRVRRARSRRPGRVIAQSPRPGVVRRRNFPVNLVVGRR